MNKSIGTTTGAVLTCPNMHAHGVLPLDVAYGADEPLTINLVTQDAAGTVYGWTVSRRLVEQACVDGDQYDCAVVGIGDVTLKVRRTDPRAITLRLPVERDGRRRGYVYLIVSRDELLQFVAETYELVPAHREVEHLDLDRIDDLVEEWK